MKIVIIGAGPAGVTVAETLREYDERSEIVILSSEPYPPYSPPAMVEYFLTGNPLHLWKGEDFPSRMRVDYRCGRRVVALQPQECRLLLDNGEYLAYHQLVIAAGSRLYAPVKGADKAGIHNFKSLQAGEELLARVRGKRVRTALIVGAGFVGVEIALLLRELGLEVRLLIRSRVMRGMLDPESSQMVQGMLRARGIEILQGPDADAVEFLGEGRAEAVLMRSGARLEADLLVAATGLKPNLEFLAGSGVKTDWGVLVDDHLRASLDGIYAAGDVAETVDRLSGRRYAHANFPNAVAQGRLVALNLLGWDLPYQGADNMNSLKHLGLPVMAAGLMEGEVLRRRRHGRLSKLWVKEGRLVGFRLVGDVSRAGIYLSLMRRAVDVTPILEHLLDPSFGMAYLTDLAAFPG